MTSSTQVFLVEDDRGLREALSFLFGSRNVPVQMFETAEAFLAIYRPDIRGCILTDIRLPGKSGIELFDQLKDMGASQPVIMLTGHGDVGMAVDALKRGVRDFIEKPFNDNDLVDRVLAVMADYQQELLRAASEQSLQERLTTLSERETDVLPLLVSGQPNKMIAATLGISIRTVEVHRARILEKMQVRTAVELAGLIGGRMVNT